MTTKVSRAFLGVSLAWALACTEGADGHGTGARDLSTSDAGGDGGAAAPDATRDAGRDGQDAGRSDARADGGAAGMDAATDAADAGSSSAWPIERVTVGAGGVESDASVTRLVTSDTGRFVGFIAQATSITAEPAIGRGFFLRDRMADTTQLVNRDDSNVQQPVLADIDLSDDGTRVLFRGRRDFFFDEPLQTLEIFVRDLQTQTTTIASLPDGPGFLLGGAEEGALSGNGRYVAFTSDSATFPEPGGHSQVYRRDLEAGETILVSQGAAGSGDRASGKPRLSDDGSRVVFESRALNLVPETRESRRRVYLRDLDAGTTELVSVSTSGELAESNAQAAEISGDGRFVIFRTTWPLVEGIQALPYIYLRDTELGTTIVASVDENGDPVRCLEASISDDGRYVAFVTADPASADDTNAVTDIFVFDRMSGTSRRVSYNHERADPGEPAALPRISGDGRFAAFTTSAPGMVPEKTTVHVDGYVVDLQSAD